MNIKNIYNAVKDFFNKYNKPIGAFIILGATVSNPIATTLAVAGCMIIYKDEG